jgi:hypothetical protein
MAQVHRHLMNLGQLLTLDFQLAVPPDRSHGSGTLPHWNTVNAIAGHISQRLSLLVNIIYVIRHKTGAVLH